MERAKLTNITIPPKGPQRSLAFHTSITTYHVLSAAEPAPVVAGIWLLFEELAVLVFMLDISRTNSVVEVQRVRRRNPHS